MKTILKYILLPIMALPSIGYAQLQNLDFELWDKPVDFEVITQNNPTGWVCTNRWYGFEEGQFTNLFTNPIDTIAFTNHYALRLFTFYNYMKDAAAQRTAINSRPSTLTGQYKYEHNFIEWARLYTIDTAQVSIWLTKWNPALSKRDTIGLGFFRTADSTPVFKRFHVDIRYVSDEMPDSVTLYLDPSTIGRDPLKDVQTSAGGGSSTFTLDNLILGNGPSTGINEKQSSTPLILYPNPAHDWIRTEHQSGEATILSITGKQLVQFELTEGQNIDIHSFDPGIYVLRVNNPEGISTSRFIKQ